MKYLHTYPPIELMINFLSEDRSNERKRVTAKSLQERDFENIPDSVVEMVKAEHDAERKLREWLWENVSDSEKTIIAEEYQKKAYLDDEIDRLKQTFLIDIGEVVSKYRSYVEYGYHDLEKAYCQLDCFKHKRQIELVYEPIVERHRELIWMIKDKGSSILSYNDDKEFIAPLIYEILEIQNIIFTREETQMDAHLFNERVLNTYLFQIENAVYSVAEELYGKEIDWRKPLEDDYYTDGWLSTYNIIDNPDTKGNSSI